MYTITSITDINELSCKEMNIFDRLAELADTNHLTAKGWRIASCLQVKKAKVL